MRTCINLYTTREIDEPLPSILERVAEAGYDGVQFAGLGDASAEDLAATLERTGLGVAPPHVGIDALESDPDDVIQTYAPLECDAFVVPYLPVEDFATEAAIAETIDRLNDLRDRLRDRGVDLLYHNHDNEFVEVDGEPAFDRLLAETELGMEIDVGWVAAAGHDPVELVERVGDRGDDVIHLKDMDVSTGTPVEIGTGDVDMDACIEAARGVGVRWATYEHDSPADPIASIGRGAEFLASH